MVTKMAIPAAGETAAAGASAKACTHHLLQVQGPQPGCKCGKLRPARKLHALTGLWLALFVSAHLAICLTGLRPRQYQGAVDLIHRGLAYLPGAVLLLVLLPLLLQAASGLYLAVKEGMKYDIKRCDRGGKLRFFVQRLSGLAILAFLLVHVASMNGRLPFALRGYASGGLHNGAAFASAASAFRPWTSPAANVITVAFLLTGIVGVAFHAANGALSGAILWKVVESPRGKACWRYVCTGVWIALSAMGTVAWYAFTLSPNVHAIVNKR